MTKRDYRPAGEEHVNKRTRYEILQSKPHLTDAEVEMIFQAGKKSALPVFNLEHAKLILSDNVWVFEPAWDAPYGLGSGFNTANYDDLARRPPYRHFYAFRDQWPDGVVAALSAATAMARTLKIISGKDLMDDPDLMAHAIDLERRAREAFRLGLSELPDEEKPAV